MRYISSTEPSPGTVNVTQESHNWSSLGWSNSVCKEFASGYRTCPDYAEHFKRPDSLYVKHGGLLYFKSQMMMRVCVPSTQDNYLRTSIISCFHDSNIAAHPGAQRTFLRIAQWYHWPTLNQDVRDYVRSCETCTVWKDSNARKNGRIIPSRARKNVGQ